MRVTDGRLAAIAICARRYASGLCRRVEFKPFATINTRPRSRMLPYFGLWGYFAFL
jgi:hypothetical protein